jgi:CRISPR/Cas system Type II protein with McrA/HNH and RuvC-like nuclease domain
LNVTRREKRSIRRQQSRRKTRKRDFIKFLIVNNYIDVALDKKGNFVKTFIEKYITNDAEVNLATEKNQLDGIYKLRLSGIKNKLSFEQQLKVMFYYLSKRGFTYDITSEKNKDKDDKELSKSRKESEGFLPIESQIKYYNENGFLKGSFNRTLNNDD